MAVDDEDPNEWRYRGDQYVKTEQYEEAIQCYQYATYLDPEYLSAWNNLGYAYSKLGRADEAKKVRERINQIKGKQEKASLGKGGPIQPVQEQKKTINKEKNPALAAILSFIIVGLGQVYNGDVVRGFLFLIGTVIGLVLLVIPGIIVFFFGIYDAYSTAKKMNNGEVPYKETKTLHLILYFIAVIAVIIFLSAAIAAFVYGMAGTVDQSSTSDVQITPTQPIDTSYQGVKCGSEYCEIGDICCNGRCYANPGPNYQFDSQTCKIYPKGTVLCGGGYCEGECCNGRCYEPCSVDYFRANDCNCYEKGGAMWEGPK